MYQQKISTGGGFSPAVSEPAVARPLGQSASQDRKKPYPVTHPITVSN